MKARTDHAARQDLATSGKVFLLATGLLIGAALFAAAAQGQQLAQGGGVEGRSLDPWNVPAGRQQQGVTREPAPPSLRPDSPRHIAYIQGGVPVEYRGQRNRYPNVPKAITAGGEVYRANCIACHGPRGRGDGDAGLDLFPSPALLTELTEQKGAADEYLLWTISEGGAAFGTAMPAFKSQLSQDQIWQVVTYLRAGLPEQ